MKNLISVIIPTYNRGRILKKTIYSALKQTYKKIEVIVVDDGSTDNTANVLDQINDKRLKYFRIKHSGLPAVPRNFGLEVSKGDWIAFLDSDDVWNPDKLEIQLKSLRLKSLSCGCSNAHLVKNGSKKLMLSEKNKILDFKSLIFVNGIICSSVLIRKTTILNSNSFVESHNMKALEDYNLWLKIATKNRFDYIGKPLLKYTDDPSTSIRRDSPNEYQQRRIVLSNLLIWCFENGITWRYKLQVLKSLIKAYLNSK